MDERSSTPNTAMQLRVCAVSGEFVTGIVNMRHLRRQRHLRIPMTRWDAATRRNTTAWSRYIRPSPFRLKHFPLLALVLQLGFSVKLTAQTLPTDSSQLRTTYIFVGIGGFVPMTDSYRLNYSTRLAGVPVEINGGFVFPISRDVLAPVTVRYVRREANFIDGTAIKVLSLEPGVRFYLEKEGNGDLRIFGGVEGLIAQASVSSVFDVTTYDPTSNVVEVTGRAAAGKDYFNFGIGFDVGIAYPLTASTALDGIVHTAMFLANPVSHGGLGNIGGVSLTAAYRFGF